MGTVGVTFRIMPTDKDVDLEALKAKIKEVIPPKVTLTGIDTVPIAFGLKALMVDLMMEDTSPDALEAALSSVEGVQRAEVEKVGRLL
jgi:elongation factor 1-beta